MPRVSHRVIYELRVYGELAARGTIDLIAETLCIAVSTARTYQFDGHGPDYVEIKSIPAVYIWRDGEHSLDSIARAAGVKKNTVSSALCKGVPLKGSLVRRVGVDSFTIGSDGVERILQSHKRGEEDG